jgi:hypothetical protein
MFSLTSFNLLYLSICISSYPTFLSFFSFFWLVSLFLLNIIKRLIRIMPVFGSFPDDDYEDCLLLPHYLGYFFIASGVGLSPLYCSHFWPIVPAPDDR